MTVRVNLKDLVDALEFQMEETSAYLKKSTGKIVHVTDAEVEAAESEGDESGLEDCDPELVAGARDVLEHEEDYVPLPDPFDLDEYHMMEDFCLSVADQQTSKALLLAIQGTGAFRRFKDGIHMFGVADAWCKFRDAAYEKAAKEWCKEKGIEYAED